MVRKRHNIVYSNVFYVSRIFGYGGKCLARQARDCSKVTEVDVWVLAASRLGDACIILSKLSGVRTLQDRTREVHFSLRANNSNGNLDVSLKAQIRIQRLFVNCFTVLLPV